MAPEVLKGKVVLAVVLDVQTNGTLLSVLWNVVPPGQYSNACDLWSIGKRD